MDGCLPISNFDTALVAAEGMVGIGKERGTPG